MPFNDPLPPPITTISTPIRVVDVQALRAALRLVLTPGDADEAARRLPKSGDLEDLGPVVREALDRARMERWLARLRLRRREADGRSLGPASGVPAEVAIALALTVGLRLDARDLADAMDVRAERVGVWLVVARRALGSEMPAPCRKTAALVGRYDDRSLDPDDRVELLSHLNRCPTCQEVVDRSRVVDAAIADEVTRLRSTVAERQVAGITRLEQARRVALLIGMVLIALTAVVTAGAVPGRLGIGKHEPSPLVLAARPSPYSGWLVISRADGNVQARNLATGETRRVFQTVAPISGVSQEVTLSPGGTRLMTYVGEYSQSSRSRVIVSELDGTEVGRVEWASENVIYYPSGWVDERHILVSVFPVFAQSQTTAEFAEQFASESRILVVDIETGAAREVLRGNVYIGIPSPDGRFVAVARPTDSEAFLRNLNSFRTEIWPIESDGVTEPIVTIDESNSPFPQLVWSRDGTRVFMTQPANSPGGDDSASLREQEPRQLVMIGLDGERRTLVEVDDDSAIYPISVEPDGASVVYLQAERSFTLPAVSYWRVGLDGGPPEQVSEAVSESYSGAGVAWSPDGETILVGEVTVPYLERNVREWTRWNAATTEIVAIGRAGQRTTLLTSFAVGDRLLGWLPEDALPREDAGERSKDITYSDPEPVSGLPDKTQLGSASAASTNGRYLTLDDVAVGSPLVWDTISGDTQRLRGSLEDAVWLPGTTGLLTVSGSGGERRSASHLSVLAPTNPYAPLVFEPRPFDPVGMEVGGARHYAAPRVSPDGINTSFYVVDADAGSVELWVANAAGGASRVTGWRLPDDWIIAPPLAARWVNGRTLVFVEPRDWSQGMPETAALRRLTVADDGSATVEDVVELAGRGDDRGIAVIELAVSASGADVAWRTRHYTELAADDGRFDTIHLAPVDDVTRDVEAVRGSPGTGLAWSTDGRLLLAGIDHEVALVEAGDLDIHVISGADRAEFPLWIGEEEIWYSARDAHRVMRVRIE